MIFMASLSFLTYDLMTNENFYGLLSLISSIDVIILFIITTAQSGEITDHNLYTLVVIFC